MQKGSINWGSLRGLWQRASMRPSAIDLIGRFNPAENFRLNEKMCTFHSKKTQLARSDCSVSVQY